METNERFKASHGPGVAGPIVETYVILQQLWQKRPMPIDISLLFFAVGLMGGPIPVLSSSPTVDLDSHPARSSNAGKWRR